MSDTTSYSARAFLLWVTTVLTTDLDTGANILELTQALVLRNILRNLKQGSTRLYPLLRIIIPYVILLGGFHVVAKTVVLGVIAWAKAPFTSRIIVPADHHLNRDVLAWLAAHGLGQDARTVTLSFDVGHAEHNARNSRRPSMRNSGYAHGFIQSLKTSLGFFYSPAYSSDDSCDGQENKSPSKVEELFSSGDTATSAKLRYVPDFGTYRFRFNGSFMTMKMQVPQARHIAPANTNDWAVRANIPDFDEPDPTKPHKITLECFPTLRGLASLQEFLEHVKKSVNPPQENMTAIYRAAGPVDDSEDGQWSLAATRSARSLDSVALEYSKKDALVKDITYYLTPECKRFYAKRGYPYRRGFLLYGPPGTGKTSFSVALAGHFKLDIYILSLSSKYMNDEKVELLFDELPASCILLLEDVDSAGLAREKTEAELKEL